MWSGEEPEELLEPELSTESSDSIAASSRSESKTAAKYSSSDSESCLMPVGEGTCQSGGLVTRLGRSSAVCSYDVMNQLLMDMCGAASQTLLARAYRTTILVKECPGFLAKSHKGGEQAGESSDDESLLVISKSDQARA